MTSPPEYPEDTPVLARYPLTDAQNNAETRESWPWLSAVVTKVCGPDEWQVEIVADEVATDQLGRPAGSDVAPEDRWYPLAFRDSSELKPAEAEAGS